LRTKAIGPFTPGNPACTGVGAPTIPAASSVAVTAHLDGCRVIDSVLIAPSYLF
jgi:hypothetical protein